MGRLLRPIFVVLTVMLSLSPSVSARPRPLTAADSLFRARKLVEWAGEELADSSLVARERATRDLRHSIEIEPSNPQAWLLLGRAREIGGFRAMARESFREAARLAPNRPEAWTEMGWSWKRSWLRTLDPAALDSAIAAFNAATRARPHASAAWLGLVPLRFETRDLAGAEEAATRARQGFPRSPEILLAQAYTAFRNGEVERADSVFAAAMPRIDPTVRALFERPAWIGLPASVTGGASGKPGSTWDGLDPDPTTTANELQLEYASRVAHAFLLFYDPMTPELDSRAEVYVRYGPPGQVAFNPAGSPTAVQYLHIRPTPGTVASSYPADVQVWSYPQLGMRVVMQDRSLLGRFNTFSGSDFDPASLPDPHVMASRADLVSLGNGLAVFPTRPPRDQSLDVRTTLARFANGGSQRLVTLVQAPGGPADSLWARWMVSDSTGKVIARDMHPLGLSACDPAGSRVAEFTCDLPPGAFEVVVSASDAKHRRGVVRNRATIEAQEPGLALSDIVLACGDPTNQVSSSQVRLEANFEGSVSSSRPLAVYFEIGHLAMGADGQSRFEYEYSVRRDLDGGTRKARHGDRDDGATPLLSATRQESQVGELRRQFVTVPTQRLAVGSYRLTIRVRDLVGGGVGEGTVAFTRR